MAQDYKANEEAADARYKGKKFYIRGRVTYNSGDFDLYGEPALGVDGILCRLKNQRDEARAPKGKDVTIFGTVDGLSYGGVHVVGCELASK